MFSPGKVSVIVPNNGRDLTALVRSVNNSTYKNIEVIVVDEGKERSVQRNLGFERSSGEYLLFLDSDMTISPELIQHCVLLSEYGTDGIYVPEIIVGHPVKTFFRSFYNGTCVDAIRFLKRKFFIPFDEDITGFEDWDFDRRFQGRKGMSVYPLFHHSKGGIKKKLYYTKWVNKYKEKYPECKELSLKYRLWTVFVEEGKWKKFLSLHPSSDRI